jgi:hypothetical protein
MVNRKELIQDLVEDARNIRLCGPSDDLEEQTGVTSSYRYLVIQFKRVVAPMLKAEAASRLNAIEVEIDNIYSVYEAKAELDALLPDIEEALEGNESGVVAAEDDLLPLCNRKTFDADIARFTGSLKNSPQLGERLLQ